MWIEMIVQMIDLVNGLCNFLHKTHCTKCTKQHAMFKTKYRILPSWNSTKSNTWWYCNKIETAITNFVVIRQKIRH